MIRRSASLLGLQVLLLIVTIPGSIVVARALGPSGRGVFGVLTNGVAVLVTICNAGFGTGLMVFTAKEQISVRTMLGYAIAVAGLIWLISIVSFASIPLIRDDLLFHAVPVVYVWVLLFSQYPATLLAGYLQSILQGMNLITLVTVVDTMGAIFVTVAAIIALIVFHFGLTVVVIIAAVQAPVAVLLLLYVVIARSGLPIRGRIAELRTLLAFGAYKHLGNSSGYLLLRLDTIILNLTMGPTQVGYYTVAVAIAERIWVFGGVIERVVYPSISAGTESRARALAVTSCRHSVLIGVALVAALCLAGHTIVRILYGGAYLPSVMPLYCLLPGMVFYLVTRIIDAFFTGQQRRPLVPSVISLVILLLSVPVYAVMIRTWGTSGAAAASSVLYGAQMIWLALRFCRDTGVTMRELLLPTRADAAVYAALIGRVLHGLGSRVRLLTGQGP